MDDVSFSRVAGTFTKVRVVLRDRMENFITGKWLL